MTELPTYPLTAEGVTDALNALDKGGSEGVAIRLTELGITGQRDNDCACPIANYLLKAITGVESAVVSLEAVYLTGETRDISGAGYDIAFDVRFSSTLPDSVSAFVDDFDQGIYPELIEPTREVNPDAAAA